MVINQITNDNFTSTYRVLNVKALVVNFNQKALVGAFSVIVKSSQKFVSI